MIKKLSQRAKKVYTIVFLHFAHLSRNTKIGLTAYCKCRKGITHTGRQRATFTYDQFPGMALFHHYTYRTH